MQPLHCHIKCQVQYFIDSGNNIDSADQMFEAMWSATVLCGFTVIVLDSRGQKYTKQTQIKNISKIHVKYIYDDTKNEYDPSQKNKLRFNWDKLCKLISN